MIIPIIIIIIIIIIIVIQMWTSDVGDFSISFVPVSFVV